MPILIKRSLHTDFDEIDLYHASGIIFNRHLYKT
jgi:hypothetical protein